MAGGISFGPDSWESKSSAVAFAMDFIAERLPKGPQRSTVKELVDNNVLMLDLSEPVFQDAVDILADDLPRYIGGLTDPARQENLNRLFVDLIETARRHQRRGEDS